MFVLGITGGIGSGKSTVSGILAERGLLVLDADEIYIDISVGNGEGTATAWGCDLTYDYVKINGDYRT